MGMAFGRCGRKLAAHLSEWVKGIHALPAPTELGRTPSPSLAFWRWCAPAHQPRKANAMTSKTTARIAELNDILRTTFLTGRALMTEGIRALPEETQSRIVEAVQIFTDFTPDNDPHGEHDFGAVTIEGHKVFWKIDYYAPDMMHGSDDPSDPKQTRRVLTIMLTEEY